MVFLKDQSLKSVKWKVFLFGMNKSYKRHNKMLPLRRVYLNFIDAFECKNVEKSNPVDINATLKADS